MSTPQLSKAKFKWLVAIKTDDRSMEGVTFNVSPNGAFIRCANPLRLNEVCNLAIQVPDKDVPVEVKAEVVWSNIYGPDDGISPRGMGVRFLEISSEDREALAKEMLQSLQTEQVDPMQLEALNTILMDQDEVSSEAA
jgi:uncharacterized protein (TIGR02266 family)